MSYLFSFSRYQTKCVIELLFRQSMTSWNLWFIFDHPLKQWPTGRKRRKDRNTKNWIPREQKELFRWNKSIFHSFWKTIIWWKQQTQALSDCLQIHYCKAVRADIKPEQKLNNMVWRLIVQSVCSAVLTVSKFLFVKLLLPQGRFQKKQTVWGGGEKGLRTFPGELKK